jgi:uncharacterized integral membrane protein
MLLRERNARDRNARDLARSGGPNPSGGRPEDPVDAAEASPRSHAGAAGFILGALLAAAVVLLIAQNTDTVSMDWLVFDLDGPLWMFIGLAFVAGLVAAPLLLGAFRHARRVRRTKRQLVADARRG